MWSLFELEKGEEDSSKLEKIRELKPKVFSNGKNQADIVSEVVEEIKKGRKIVFIHGVCGSGKSAIALNIARELGKASIVVPIKNLQKQYEEDYMHKKFLLKENGKKLKIEMITGRRNHICPYLEENRINLEETRTKEKNANLYDLFERKEEIDLFKDLSCDNHIIPCKIEIKQKNLKTIKKYYSENPEAKNNSNLDLKIIKRFAVAPSCSYWSPIINSEMKIKMNGDKKEYKSVAGEHTIYLRKSGCPYYRQFLSYLDADVIIFNSEQYLLETAIGRKPATDVEIIDECDEFLDSFALEETINLSRLKNELKSLFCDEENQKKIIQGVSNDILEVIDENIDRKEEEIIKASNTKIGETIKSLVKNDLLDYAREDSYLEHCVEVAEKFYELIEEAYASFYKDRKGDIYVKLVTINLDKMLGEIIDKNKAFVFMSGTLHSPRVLEEIFGLKDFKIIEAETFNQGTITRLNSGLERDFKFENFNRRAVTREQYLKALDKCIEISKIPTVVQVNAFQDLPSKEELINFQLKNLISSEELIEMQKSDRDGALVKEFKSGKKEILFTTRCTRGIDFPFETCNSVVITKFPYPNTRSLFWKILKKNKPEFFWDFYKDKAHRELLQRVYRSVRASNDHVYLLSPDIRVLQSKVI